MSVLGYVLAATLLPAGGGSAASLPLLPLSTATLQAAAPKAPPANTPPKPAPAAAPPPKQPSGARPAPMVPDPDPPAGAPADPYDDDDAPAPGAAKGGAAPPSGDANGNAGRPQAAPKPTPVDPLAVPPEMAARIGSDDLTLQPGAQGEAVRRWYGLYYGESQGDYRLTLTPLTLDVERGLGPGGVPTAAYNHEALYGYLYYRRRSREREADVLFPLFWRVRTQDSSLWAFLPYLHREATEEHDNWLAPLFFEGKRKTSGYFHVPLLATISSYGEKSAFTLVGPYFRTRSFESVDQGLFPLFFTGDNHNDEGAERRYTLVPPLLFYSRYDELSEDKLTVAGPLLLETTPKRSIVDVLPLFFHIQGRPETGGKRESHTTLLPFFHVGSTDEQRTVVVPGYFRRETPDSDTMLTPLYSYLSSRRGAARSTAVGPVVPLVFWSRDKDTGASSTSVAPLFHTSSSPEGTSLLTPLFGRWETYGVSKRYWALPTFFYGQSTLGWDLALHPLLYFGRGESSSHAVAAPLYWDFKSESGRATVAFPFVWRFAGAANDSVTQVAVNTLYMQKNVAGGRESQFHILPLVSWGQGPESHFWNFLFGLAGYSRDGDTRTLRAFWIPITLSSGAAPSRAARR